MENEVHMTVKNFRAYAQYELRMIHGDKTLLSQLLDHLRL